VPDRDPAAALDSVRGVGIDRTAVRRLRGALHRGGDRLVERLLRPEERERQVETYGGDDGRPAVRLHGTARDRAAALRVDRWHLAVTTAGEAVLAVAIATGPVTPGRAGR
jgi:phosphopantetheinyl transferase (holo-ACP synthase)